MRNTAAIGLGLARAASVGGVEPRGSPYPDCRRGKWHRRGHDHLDRGPTARRGNSAEQMTFTPRSVRRRVM
jgi:hypothetical protein